MAWRQELFEDGTYGTSERGVSIRASPDGSCMLAEFADGRVKEIPGLMPPPAVTPKVASQATPSPGSIAPIPIVNKVSSKQNPKAASEAIPIPTQGSAASSSSGGAGAITPNKAVAAPAPLVHTDTGAPPQGCSLKPVWEQFSCSHVFRVAQNSSTFVLGKILFLEPR